ncbi:hypothetical protein [Bacillus sp. SJS]|uniref:hypothetical protein n=1 Tax=Bacillus sp. SJS TaxID=1423321 RepID=UPI0004DCE050|nr:hypothetical protein [Bacillus sp. SJS]KZZ85762.1 hypothetical protein AS29_004010 [Bacillus sp. SJS]
MKNKSVFLYYGILHIPDRNILPCVITINRIDGESDWLDISIPQAAFKMSYLYKYPLTKKLNPWLNSVEETFIKLAETIYNDSPFDLAIIGEEVSGDANQETVTLDHLESASFILPIALQKRLKTQEKGKVLSNNLTLFN